MYFVCVIQFSNSVNSFRRNKFELITFWHILCMSDFTADLHAAASQEALVQIAALPAFVIQS